MNNTKDVLLCSTLHDPRGVFLDALSNASDVVLKGYRGWVVNVTTTTDIRVKEALRALAPFGVVMTETDTANPIVEDKVENDHLYLLKQTVDIAKQLNVERLAYVDGDRIITAANHYPRYLLEMADRASKLVGDGAYVNFRRDVEDYVAHHPPLVQTELEFNRLYSEVFKILIDIGSTAHGMSLKVAEEIVRRSPHMDTVSFPHPKWLIVAQEMGIRITSEVAPRVLTFETPDQFINEVNERIDQAKTNFGLLPNPTSSPYVEEQQDYMATLGLESTLRIEEWDLRFNTLRQYLTVLMNNLDIFGFTQERIRELQDDIKRSLVSMEGRHKTISEALRTPSNEVRQIKEESARRLDEVLEAISRIEAEELKK